MAQESTLEGVERELNCEGYYGFGGGYVQGMAPGPGEMYCGTCPLKQSCWDKHRERVRGLLPEMTRAFDELARQHQGPELLRIWWQRHNCADPYMAIMVRNVQDGISVAMIGSPMARGIDTLPFPFARH